MFLLMNRLGKFLCFIFALSLHFCEAAQFESVKLNVMGESFTFNTLEKCWKSQAAKVLTSGDVYNYFASIVDSQSRSTQSLSKGRFKFILESKLNGAMRCLERLLDVQEPSKEYLKRIKRGLLVQGHLGYFPGISFYPGERPEDELVNKMVPRGIFNIVPKIANRVFSVPLNYISPLTNFEYRIDSQNKPNDLESAADELVHLILSTSDINDLKVKQVGQDLIHLEFRYVGSPDVRNIRTNPIGLTAEYQASNEIRVVIRVLNGFIEIIKMCPI